METMSWRSRPSENWKRCRGAYHLGLCESVSWRFIATNAGRILPQDELLHRVWVPDYAGATAFLRTAIRRLRRKIERDPSSPRDVLAKRGVGYQFAQR